MLPWKRLPICPRPIAMRLIAFASSMVLFHASTDTATSTTTTIRLMRHDRRANAARGVSSSDVMTAAATRSARPAPAERNVLARLPAAIHLEAKRVGAIHLRRSPRRDGVGPDLGTRGIQRLHALAEQCRRTGQRFGPRFDLPRDRGPPRRKILRHLEFDRHEDDAPAPCGAPPALL